MLALAVGVTPLICSENAEADGSFGVDGSFRQGPLREDFTVQQWLAACGAAPTSSTKGGGESVTIRQDGNELVLTGGGRTFRTDQCYDPLPTLAADVHTREGAGPDWRTHCATPSGDPRRASIQTLVAIAGTNHLDISETGRYEIAVDQGLCIADVRRSRSLDRVTAASAATIAIPTAAAPTAKPSVGSSPGTCANPGPPASLEVHPSRKVLKAGDSFAFRADVRDSSGCTTDTVPTWSIAGAADDARRATVDASGNVTIPADASEGKSVLLVTAAGRSAEVTLEVTSPAHLEELLANGSLDAAADNGAVVSLVATAGVGTGGEPIRAQDESAHRRAIFVAIVSALAVALAVVAFIFHRRSRKAQAIEERALARHAERVREVEERREARRAKHAQEQRAHDESVERARRAKSEEAEAMRTPTDVPLHCSTCRREFPSIERGGGAYCPHDATRLSPANEASQSPRGGGSLCPTCQRGYAAGVKTCPVDGDELVPVAMALARPAAAGVVAAVARGKICPTCGGRFDGAATFCGKDGTALVLLN